MVQLSRTLPDSPSPAHIETPKSAIWPKRPLPRPALIPYGPSTPMPRRKPRSIPAPARPTPPETAAKALAELHDRLRAMPAAEVERVTANIPRAVSIALGAAPRIAALRESVTQHLPLFDLAHIDELPTLAMAAWYAHLQFIASKDDPGVSAQFDATLARAVELRGTLLGDAEALARRGLVDTGRVAEIREGRGHLDTANDLVALSALFEEAWPRVEGRTAATSQEIEEAAEHGTTLLVALARRGEPGAAISPSAADAADLRARAFTALRKSYHQCRRAVGYLRWDEDDVKAIAPSLFSPRRASRRREPAEGDEVVEAGVDAVDDAAAASADA